MNVFHVLPPVKFGGGEAVLIGLASLGRGLGHCETVCCLYQSVEFERVLDDAQISWMRLSNISAGSGASRNLSKLYAIIIILKLRCFLRIINENKPDVIHLHGFPSSLIGALIKKWFKVKGRKPPWMVYTHHAVSGNKSQLEVKIFDWIYKEMDYVTGVSQASVDSLLRDHALSINRVAVIQNFASSSFYEVGYRRKIDCRERSNFIRFINVARFIPLKNQIAIVAAVSQLSVVERERTKVIFVGDGETLFTIKSEVMSRGLDDCFDFKGFVKNEDIPSLLAEADVMIFPSKNEGSPIAVAEGLAAGLPILGLKICDGVVQVAAYAGYFVEEADLAEGIRYMLHCDLSALSKKAMVRAKKFDPVVIKDAYLNIYSLAFHGDANLSQGHRTK